MNIRCFTSSDAQQVVALWQECGLTVPWNDPQKDIERKLSVEADLFLVGELEGRIMASAMGGYDGHRGSVNYLAVLPRHQKKGFGEALLREVETRLLELGCPKINLMVRTTNQPVISFYEGCGYTKDPVVCIGKRLIPDGDPAKR
ncbi:GNAT family acetyltransferase [Desulfoluna spongiiphila]|uniref:GNAT family acetyltransferase n=1 Tax=Desulfoluna spongiiphila TaxID=419481 RepID=UPI00125984B0|nr:GNAT family acetyltransferase [Desulfoluna spongiiphila]VVS91989.1 acyl-coa n-acyltransferase [Desulfoluna spongiiphila]